MSNHPYPYTPLSIPWNFPLATHYIEAYPGAAKFPSSRSPIPEIEALVNEGRWTHDDRGFRLTGTDQYTLHATGPRRIGQPLIEKLDASRMREYQLRRADAERRRFEQEMQQREAARRASEEGRRDLAQDLSSRRGVRFAPTNRVRMVDYETGGWGEEGEEVSGDNEGRSDEYRRQFKESVRRRKDQGYMGGYQATERSGYRGPLW